MDGLADKTGRAGGRLDGWLVFGMVVAVAVRLAPALAVSLSPRLEQRVAETFPDSMSYHHAATSLLEEGELWFSEARRPEEGQRAKREPGYPFFVAGCYAVFGRRPLAVRLVQAVLGALLCWPVYALAARLGGRRGGRAAALLTAVYPVLALVSALVLTETLFALLLWLALWVTTEADGRRYAAPAAGLAWAGLALVRSETLFLFLAVAAVALVVSPRRRDLVPRLVAGLAGLILVTGLWAWRNQRVVGHPVFTTLNVGETLYDSLWAGADGSSDKQAFEHVYRTWEWEALNGEVERDRWLRQRAFVYARTHPGHVGRLALRKLARTWSPVPNVRMGGRAAHAIMAGAFAVVVLGGLAGCIIHRRRWRTWAPWLVPVLVMTAAHVVIVGSIRYRVPVMPFFLVMAGASLCRPRRTVDA